MQDELTISRPVMKMPPREEAPTPVGLPPGLELVVGTLAMRAKRRRNFRIYALLADLFAIVAAFTLASLIRFSDVVGSQLWMMLSVLLPLHLLIGMNRAAYKIASAVDARSGIRASLTAFGTALSAVLLVVFFLKVSEDFSRAMFGIGALCSAVLLVSARGLLARYARRVLGPTAFNEVVIEDGLKLPASPHSIILDSERDGIKPYLNSPAMLDRLGRCLLNADRVIVACPPERRELWATALKGADVQAEVVAPELELVGALSIGSFNGRSTMVVASGPLGIIDRGLKRALDLSIVLLSAPVTVPLMLAVAIAIKLDSRGPVFFRQQRVGLGNRLFYMYKFRSMYVDQSDGLGHRSTGRSDQRITPVGRFIRRTSLDELPQILNVLTGSMSIVGPRPHALGSRAEELFFWDINLNYWHRHAIKPGMTGLAQVRGFRGATERTSDLENRLQADLEYISGWSIWRDLKIIASTIRVVMHRNAF